MTIEEIERTPMVFIIGIGRSGTTILRAMMDASHESIFPPESQLIIYLKKKYFHQRAWTKAKVNEFIVDLYKEAKFRHYWNIDEEKLRSYILSFPLEKLTFQLMIKMVYLCYPSPFEKSVIKIIGDKNPGYSVYIDELMEIFPDIKFIHVVRDYRDNILSRKKAAKGKSIAYLTYWWWIYNRHIERIKKKHPERIYTIRYIDLVEDPENKISQIYSFCGLKFDRKVLRYYENLDQNLDHDYLEIIREIKPNILREVNVNNVGKWETELSHNELEVITYILGEYGKIYNYEPYSKYSGKSYRFKSIIALISCYKDVAITKIYYLLPFTVRNILANISKLLFSRFGYYNSYNHHNYVLESLKKDS